MFVTTNSAGLVWDPPICLDSHFIADTVYFGTVKNLLNTRKHAMTARPRLPDQEHGKNNFLPMLREKVMSN